MDPLAVVIVAMLILALVRLRKWLALPWPEFCPLCGSPAPAGGGPCFHWGDSGTCDYVFYPEELKRVLRKR